MSAMFHSVQKWAEKTLWGKKNLYSLKQRYLNGLWGRAVLWVAFSFLFCCFDGGSTVEVELKAVFGGAAVSQGCRAGQALLVALEQLLLLAALGEWSWLCAHTAVS